MATQPSTPPQAPPPDGAVVLFVRLLAARERRIELERTIPPAAETVSGGIVMPVRDQRLIDADRAEHEAAIAFFQHPWWFESFSKAEAERAVEAAARELSGSLVDDADLPPDDETMDL